MTFISLLNQNLVPPFGPPPFPGAVAALKQAIHGRWTWLSGPPMPESGTAPTATKTYGQCQTGDCGHLECQRYNSPPNTLAEYTLGQKDNLDYIGISKNEGFNIPMEFSSVSACRSIRCSAPIVHECPSVLRTHGGCNNPCMVFKSIKYRCTLVRGSYGPTKLSWFFKDKCPDAYNYPQDDPTSVFTCPSGTNYRVVFAHESSSSSSTLQP